MSAAVGLDALERWMQAVINEPGGAARGVGAPAARAWIAETGEGAAAVVAPGKHLGPLECLDVYASMVVARLVECLEEDFVSVRHLLGGAGFGRLARAYLARHPSRHYSLNALGARFPGFVRETELELADRALVSDLALLERTIQEVFDAEESERLGADELLGVPAERWGELRLAPIRAFRLLALEHPAHEYLWAVKHGEDPEPPAREPTFVRVWRRDFVVWRAPISAEQHALLAALAAGRPLAGAIGDAAEAPGADLERLGASLEGWFREWSADGMFARLEPAAGAGAG